MNDETFREDRETSGDKRGFNRLWVGLIAAVLLVAGLVLWQGRSMEGNSAEQQALAAEVEARLAHLENLVALRDIQSLKRDVAVLIKLAADDQERTKLEQAARLLDEMAAARSPQPVQAEQPEAAFQPEQAVEPEESVEPEQPVELEQPATEQSEQL